MKEELEKMLAAAPGGESLYSELHRRGKEEDFEEEDEDYEDDDEDFDEDYDEDYEEEEEER